MGLKLSRRVGEKITVSGPAVITVESIGRYSVKLDVTAEAATKIHRAEWIESQQAEPQSHELGGEG